MANGGGCRKIWKDIGKNIHLQIEFIPTMAVTTVTSFVTVVLAA